MNSVAIYYATWVLAIVSLVGTYLNIKKQKMCFVIWGVTNALWVLYDFSIGAIAQAALMLCYFVLAVHGFYEWRKGTKTSYIKIYEDRNVTAGAIAPVETEKIVGLTTTQAVQLGNVFSRHGVLHEAGEE
ncbi:hypothetical protein ANRL4_02018 [Anaerolineae bacterium]|nr:hypothetical protein ANRL4_02018 [Anaerolineae bacterium]